MTVFKKKHIKPFANTYVLIGIGFSVWMLFFDTHSLVFHKELNAEIEELNYQKKHYNTEIEKDKKIIKALSTEEGIERVARENYYMKKENEDIYIIEYEDSITQKKDYE